MTSRVVEEWVYEVWEAYATWRLWLLPPKLRDANDRLDMETMLGTGGSDDAKRAVRLLRVVDWNLVQRENQARIKFQKNWSSERDGEASDFAWVNPHE